MTCEPAAPGKELDRIARVDARDARGRAQPDRARDDHDAVAADQRRDDGRHETEQHRFVGGEDGDDAGRLGGREGEVRAGDWIARGREREVFVAPACVPHRTVDSGGDFPGGALGVDGVAGDELSGQLGGARFHHLGQAVQH